MVSRIRVTLAVLLSKINAGSYIRHVLSYTMYTVYYGSKIYFSKLASCRIVNKMDGFQEKNYVISVTTASTILSVSLNMLTSISFNIHCVCRKCVFCVHQDYPEKSFQPKVQRPYFTPPGECPRKIEIER